MKLLLLGFVIGAICAYAYRKNIRCYLKTGYVSTSKYEWQTNKLTGEMYRKKEEYFLPEAIKNMVAAGTHIAQKKTEIDEEVAATKQIIKHWRNNAKIPPSFDPLGVYEIGDTARLDLIALGQTATIEYDQCCMYAILSFSGSACLIESLSLLKPEVKEDSEFKQRMRTAIDADICFIEKLELKKLPEPLALSFVTMKWIVSRLQMPDVTDQFETRLQKLAA